MLKRLLKWLKLNITTSEQGSVLSVTLIVMVILAASVTSITQVTINLQANTTLTLDGINDQNTGKRLIDQAISEFKIYMIANEDFALYEATQIPIVLSAYNVTVTDVTGTSGFEDFGVGDIGESRAYKFAFPLSNGDDLTKYAYVSTTGSAVENYNPFDFSIGTNGDLILTGGFYRDAAFYANQIYYNKVGPYIEKTSGGTVLTPTLTPNSSNIYPDFSGSGNSADVYFTTSYEYCVSTCFSVDQLTDPFEIDKSLYTDIDGSGLETGQVQDVIITDFFSGFDYDQTVIDFVRDVGPTNNQTINDPMTIATLEAVVLANSGPPTEVCFWIWCWNEASTEPYTDITNDIYFTPTVSEETIYQGSVYNGDLLVTESFHMFDRDDETLVVIGDLTFDNTNTIYLDGKFVVTGNLYFTGDTVDMDGAFYVLGETYFQFNEGEGMTEAGSGADYGVTFMGKDNIIFESMWESHTSSAPPDEFDAFFYTEESIFIDAVNSRLNVNGVFFAGAKNLSANDIFMTDENGAPINGIVITSYRGYINASGNAVPANQNRRNGFYLDVVNSVNLQDDFVEVPVFDTIVIQEGVYTFDTSEFSTE